MWEEAFKQNQDELNAMEIEIDGLAGGLKAIINPLRKSLPGMEEAAQRLFSLAGTHKLDPIMLESIDQRGVLQASGLRQQMQPVLTAQNVVTVTSADNGSALTVQTGDFPLLYSLLFSADAFAQLSTK